jgi:murein DD-endopeptidase MepM/ murein hydrolase activator NlpD
VKRWKYIVAAIIFIALTAVKILVPGAGDTIRTQMTLLLGREDDYVQVLNYISDKLRPEESTPEAEETPDEPEREVYTPVTISSLSRECLATVKSPASPEQTQRLLSDLDTEEQQSTEQPLPDSVATFLSSQAEYSDYSIPENVTYELYQLPFAYQTPVSGYQSSGFGYRMHPILNEVRFHYGTDVAAYSGESVTAFADGTVSFAGYSDSYGNYITIEHSDGWRSLYAHCSILDVKTGESVSAGQQIALVGSTGQATGPHLHFELTHDGVYSNPEYYVNYT